MVPVPALVRLASSRQSSFFFASRLETESHYLVNPWMNHEDALSFRAARINRSTTVICFS